MYHTALLPPKLIVFLGSDSEEENLLRNLKHPSSFKMLSCATSLTGKTNNRQFHANEVRQQFFLFQFAPFVLTPSVYPRNEFVKAIELQTSLNKLVHAVAFDYEFLKETLASTIRVDDFTNELFKIYETVRSEGSGQVRRLL